MKKKNMSNEEYYDKFDGLEKSVRENGDVDRDIFTEIFYGKILPIVYSSLAGKQTGLEAYMDSDDVVQNIFIILWLKSVPFYFSKEGKTISAVGYLSWCKAEVLNYIYTLLRKKRIDPFSDEELARICENSFSGDRFSVRTILGGIYNYVAQLKVHVYKKLCWFLIYDLIFTKEAENKIKANHIVDDDYSGCTIGSLFEKVINNTGEFEYLKLTSVSQKVLSEQIETVENGKACKECLLSDFLGRDHLKSLSDYVSTINKMIMREFPGEEYLWNI